MIELLLGGFWSISYLLIVFYSFRYRNEKGLFMPLIAGALNFAWEIHAGLSSGWMWSHVLWIILDILILAYNLYILGSLKKRLIYGAFVVYCIVILWLVFRLRSINGMLLSSFVIDVIMAAEYLLVVKRISTRGRIAIGVCRALGDLFAWISNIKIDKFAAVAGVVVLIINIVYLVICVRAKRRSQ